MHPLCSLNHDQYSARLTLSTSKGFEFKHINEQQVKFIAGYFSLPYLSNTTQIMSRMNFGSETGKDFIFIPHDFKTDKLILLKNHTYDKNSDQVILGVLGPLSYENDTIDLQALYSISKSSFKIDRDLVLDFTIDGNAT